jgi:hypothetical protein
MYSRDYYCRVPQRKACELRLQHATSSVEASVLNEVRHLRLPGRVAGITEWHGAEQGYPISLGWDWMELQDGDIRPVMVIPPRTNIRLIDAKGYDVPEASAAPFFWALIASLPWARFVSRSIQDERPSGRRA